MFTTSGFSDALCTSLAAVIVVIELKAP